MKTPSNIETFSQIKQQVTICDYTIATYYTEKKRLVPDHEIQWDLPLSWAGTNHDKSLCIYLDITSLKFQCIVHSLQ